MASKSAIGHEVAVAPALNYCIRSESSHHPAEVAGSPARIWRPAESYPVESTARRKPRGTARPRWVAVNKGDVCSLVDNLVSTMIANEEDGMSSREGATCSSSQSESASVPSTSLLTPPSPLLCDKPALPVSSRCSIAASEPRKWKSDLLQRMRNEHT